MYAIVCPMRNEPPAVVSSFLRSLRDAAQDYILVVPATRMSLSSLEALRRFRDTIVLSRPDGLGDAYRAGLKVALRYNCPIITMDADGSHLPSQMDRFFGCLRRTNAHLCYGVRETNASPWSKRQVSRLMNWAVNPGGLECSTSYRLYQPEAVDEVLPEMKSRGYAFMPEFVLRARAMGLRTFPVLIDFPARLAGKSNLSMRANWREYLALFREFGLASHAERLVRR